LVKGRADYQGDSILWRKYLHSRWKRISLCLKSGGRVDYPARNGLSAKTSRVQKYVRAMDNIARMKGREILGFFDSLPVKGKILDVGAGSGAIAASFLERFPLACATLLDLPEVLDCARQMMGAESFEGRVRYRPANILEPWPVRKRDFDLVILSNILHAYSKRELPYILRSASECLRRRGLLLIHDFFPEHCPEKAALSDLNMFINTFNGRVFPVRSVLKELDHLGLCNTGLVPLRTDTGVIFAARDESALGSLHLDAVRLLISAILDLGFRKVHPIKTSDVHVPDWTDLRCRFGCDRYGSPRCPPNGPASRETRDAMKDYRHALLLEGEPPAREFQRKVLKAESEAFTAGFYKAFSYWAGPCSLCVSCKRDGTCRNTRDARPSMEGAGIDVFETVRRAGLGLRTLKRRDDFVKYYGLLLLE
jgi:predicted metal-binding protein/2-polyprenyl-3-methyl-5-hydroxy-6-metoxy-1,4-benzoquinol methylase